MPIPHVPSWIGDLDHLNGLDEAALATDLDGQVMFANTTARRLYRFLSEDLTRVSLAPALLPEDEQGAFAEIMRQTLDGVHWTGRLGVVRIDGSVHAADVSCSPLRRGDAIEGLVCVIDDAVTERGLGRDARRLADRLARLARVTAELVVAEDVETVTKVVTSHAADTVGATVASVSLLVDDDTLALASLRGAQDGAAARWATFSVHDQTPASEVARTGEPLVMIGRDAIHTRYPDLESAAPGERSMVGLPLRVMGRTIGVVTMSFPGRRTLDAAELEFLGILADSCAQALERIRAQSEAVEQAARVRFLADATTELSESLDYEVTLANVAKMAVPTFADWCAVDVVEDGKLHRLAVEHVDPSKIRFALEVEERYPSDPKAPGGVWDVINTGRSTLIPDIPDEMLVAAARDDEHLALVRRLDLRSVLMVPLVAQKKVFGVITWVTAESGRRYAPSDVAFAEDLGRRGASAIDNAQLHSETKEAAVRLQQAVLPHIDTSIGGWDLASYYSPAGRTDVGGDFYDAIPVSGGRLVLFVGDVMGRGVAAAAAMAHMRASIRAFISIDPTPEVVLRQLDRMFDMYNMNQLVTVVYMLADPEQELLTVLNAGHPPPVILRADGQVEQLPAAEGAPLGIAQEERTLQQVALHSGDTLLAFTDGLIERRAEDIDAGQRRLCEAVPGLAGRELGAAIAELVEQVRDHTREDDVAILAARPTT